MRELEGLSHPQYRARKLAKRPPEGRERLHTITVMLTHSAEKIQGGFWADNHPNEPLHPGLQPTQDQSYFLKSSKNKFTLDIILYFLYLYSKEFNRSGHTILAMITTKTHEPWPGDTEIEQYEAAGLRFPCIVRFKIFTLDNRLILRQIGRLAEDDSKKVEEYVRLFLI